MDIFHYSMLEGIIFFLIIIYLLSKEENKNNPKPNKSHENELGVVGVDFDIDRTIITNGLYLKYKEEYRYLYYITMLDAFEHCVKTDQNLLSITVDGFREKILKKSIETELIKKVLKRFELLLTKKQYNNIMKYVFEADLSDQKDIETVYTKNVELVRKYILHFTDFAKTIGAAESVYISEALRKYVGEKNGMKIEKITNAIKKGII